MASVRITHPVTGVEATILFRGHSYVEGQPMMIPVTEFEVYLSRYALSSPGSYCKRLDKAITKARWIVGDYDCAGCGAPIHWIPEPRRVYVHNSTGECSCPGGGVARLMTDERGWVVGV